MRRFCASYVESSLKREAWNWVKSANDNIGQRPQITGALVPRNSPGVPENANSWFEIHKIPERSFGNWVKSATDDIGQSILQDPHWKLPSSNCKISDRKFSQTPTRYEICFTSNSCNIYCVQLAYQGFNQTRRVFWSFDHSLDRFLIIVWGRIIFSSFCDFCDQEEQKALPLGLASALPARGQFMPQMTNVRNFF